MQSMMEGFDQIGQGMQQFATGGPIGMVTGSIKMIGGLIKSISGWFNNDKKKSVKLKLGLMRLIILKCLCGSGATDKKALGEDVYKNSKKRSLIFVDSSNLFNKCLRKKQIKRKRSR